MSGTFFADCSINPFRANQIIHPLHASRTWQQKVICTVTTIALGILSVGIAQIIACIVLYYQKNAGRFQTMFVENPNKQPGQPDFITHHIRPTEYWKDFYGEQTISDFSFQSPVVSTGFLGKDQAVLKEKIEEECLTTMREAMRASDQSMVDAINDLMQDGQMDRAVSTMNKLCHRLMDLYEAYVEVQIDQGIPMLPVEIGCVKASGLMHQEILDLREPCLWYVKEADCFIDKLRKLGLSKVDAHQLLNYIAFKNYNFDSFKSSITQYQGLEASAFKEIPEGKKLPDNIEKIIFGRDLSSSADSVKLIQCEVESFIYSLENNKSWLQKLKGLDQRFCRAKPFEQHEKEAFKRDLAAFGAESEEECPAGQRHADDPQYRLIQEIEQRMRWRDFEPGSVGSPLRLHNIARGKLDGQVKDYYFRTKLFFLYGSKNIANEVAVDPNLLKAVNEKLKQKGKNWLFDEKLAEYLRKKSPKEPVFKFGLYARENSIKGMSRHRATHQETVEKKACDPNLPFCEYERIAAKRSVRPEELDTRFRFALNESEEMSLFGTTSKYQERIKKAKKGIQMGEISKQPEHLLSKTSTPDARFNETYLEQRKKEQCQWGPGKYYFTLHDETNYSSNYLKHIREFGFETYAGISGSTEQTLTVVGLLGLQSREELMDLRIMYLPWMVGNQDHSVTEILTAYKSFGIDYTPAADYYRELYPPLANKLVEKLEKYQRERGYELPEFYLQEKHAKQVAADLEN